MVRDWETANNLAGAGGLPGKEREIFYEGRHFPVLVFLSPLCRCGKSILVVFSTWFISLRYPYAPARLLTKFLPPAA